MIYSELHALERLNHPNIISMNFAFQDIKFLYLVLDLKCGGDLRYYLRKKFIFTEKDVAFYVASLSSALEYIHSRNIIHRDVKPGIYTHTCIHTCTQLSQF